MIGTSLDSSVGRAEVSYCRGYSTGGVSSDPSQGDFFFFAFSAFHIGSNLPFTTELENYRHTRVANF